MKNEQLKNWDALKVSIKKEYPEVTEEDLHYEIGKEIELLERLEKRLQKNKAEIRKWLSLMG